MIGIWYIAYLKHAAPQQFRTPYDAMAALLGTDGEADVWVDADGHRDRLLHRDADGVWSTAR